MKIYKYLSYENAVKTLSNNSVLLNNPVEYNDPFDCVIKPSKEDEEECFKRIINYYLFKEFSSIILDKKVKIPFMLLWVRWELKLFKRLMRKHPYYDKMPGFDGMMKIAFKKYEAINKDFPTELKKNKEKFLSDIRKAIKEIKDMLLVSCFSKSNDSILLWSHYGDKHKGVCVEFDVDPKDYKEVKYSKKRKQIDLKTVTAVVLGYDYIGQQVNKDNSALIKTLTNLLLTKSRDWQYESEYRTIHSVNDADGENIYFEDDKYFLKMPQIKRVFVGCRIDEHNLLSLRDKFKGIEIIEMIDSETEYKVTEKKPVA